MSESHVSIGGLTTTYSPMESTVDCNENTIPHIKDAGNVSTTPANDANVVAAHNVNVPVATHDINAVNTGTMADMTESHTFSGTTQVSNVHQENPITESQAKATAVDEPRHNIVPNISEQYSEHANISDDQGTCSTASQVGDTSVESQITSPPNDVFSVTDAMTSSLPESTNDTTSLPSSATMSPSPSPAPAGDQSLPETSSARKKRKRRGSAWSDDQTEFLFEVWARQTDLTKDQDETNNQNAPVYRIISKAMQETGNPKSWEQCKTRIHTLKRAYKITLDEINAGAANITYCRHFEKLEIIMGDNRSTTPQLLADMLADRRKQRQEVSTSDPTPPKRKPGPCKLSTVRPTLEDTLKAAPVQPPPPTPPPPPKAVPSKKVQSKLQQALSAPQPAESATVMAPPPVAPGTQWYSQPQYAPQQSQVQHQQQQQQQQQQQHHPHEAQVNPGYQYGGDQRPTTLPPPPPYQYPAAPAKSTNTLPSVHTTPEFNNNNINNNNVMIKRERQDIKPYPQPEPQPNISIMTSQPWTTTLPKPSQKEELEKMRLNLEMRKIDMERNKLEMEERQRREERDHQYRMLQLLMIGLGQQNSAQPGQGAEQAVAQAQNSPNLSRALENGLVPGGPHSANEKGLSFNEI